MMVGREGWTSARTGRVAGVGARCSLEGDCAGRASGRAESRGGATRCDPPGWRRPARLRRSVHGKLRRAPVLRTSTGVFGAAAGFGSVDSSTSIASGIGDKLGPERALLPRLAACGWATRHDAQAGYRYARRACVCSLAVDAPPPRQTSLLFGSSRSHALAVGHRPPSPPSRMEGGLEVAVPRTPRLSKARPSATPRLQANRASTAGLGGEGMDLLSQPHRMSIMRHHPGMAGQLDETGGPSGSGLLVRHPSGQASPRLRHSMLPGGAGTTSLPSIDGSRGGGRRSSEMPTGGGPMRRTSTSPGGSSGALSPELGAPGGRRSVSQRRGSGTNRASVARMSFALKANAVLQAAAPRSTGRGAPTR